MKTRAAATLIGLALLMSHIADARAFVLGWNFLRAYDCFGYESSGVNYLYIYPTTGGSLVTTDAVAISLLAPLCASGDGFYIYNTGTAWIYISVYPSMK
jgi:hypothetical protein